MKQKQIVDYLFFTMEAGEGKPRTDQSKWAKLLIGETVVRSPIRLRERNVAGMRILEVQVDPGKKKEWKKPSATETAGLSVYSRKILTRMKKKLRSYDVEQSVVGADCLMSEVLQLEDTLFQARKQELLKNIKRILQFGRSDGENVEHEHSHMLLVLDSRNWSWQEIRAILLAAKDQYEEISVLNRGGSSGIRALIDELYEECGVVLHVWSEQEMSAIRPDFALLLLKDWEVDRWKEIPFRTAYAVADVEAGKEIRRCRERLSEKGRRKERKHKIYAGFVYEMRGNMLPYQQGANIAIQNPGLYQEFEISIVAIYRLEW